MAEFRWYGHNCFRIRGKDAVIMTDPVGKKTGFTLAKQTADIVTGIRTHQDETNGAQRGHNTSYLIELDGMVICHLGDLGHALSEEQAEAMTDVDVLLIPAGSRHLDPARAA